MLPGLDRRVRPGGRLHWPAVANAALARTVRAQFPTTSAPNRAAIDALEASFADRFRGEVPREVFRRSVQHGRDVARTIFAWSRRDGGHEGYLRNFPPEYVPPAGPGLWVPTPPGLQPALQPFWGQNRCLAIASGGDCPPGDHPPYSEDPASAFYAEANEVYTTTTALTPEQEAIARFWSDDPGATATPPGHSISIASQVLINEGVSLMGASILGLAQGRCIAEAVGALPLRRR